MVAGDPVSALAKGTRALSHVFAKAPAGTYVLFAVDRDDSGSGRGALDEISLARDGRNILVRNGFRGVAETVGKSMDSLNGGYLVLTGGDFTSENNPRTSWVWQVLAGSLLPLSGDAAWDVLQHYPTAQGYVWLSKETSYEDAWATT